MTVVAPVTVLALVFVGCLGTGRLAREGALVALTIVAVAALFITQALSTFSAITLPWVVGMWILILVGAAWAMRKQLPVGWRRVREITVGPFDAIDWLVAGTLAAFAMATLLSALLYPTTNFDSLTYHMPRVLFWFQNHSVARYPTPEGRQLFSGPLVEYVILNLKVLASGSDRLANLVQWVSYLGVIVAGSLIAAPLGASKRGQQLVAIASAATPMALLQASSTQNDLTSALWCLVFAYCVVAIVRADGNDARSETWLAAWGGIAFGLAVLTKPSAYLTCAPFVVWVALVVLRRGGWVPALRVVGVIVAVLIALNSGWYLDNARLFGGDVIGTRAPGVGHVLVTKHDPSSLATVGLKNLAMELGTPSAGVNSGLAFAVASVVHSYGGYLDNPATEDTDAGVFALDTRVTFHDTAPAPITIGLIVFAVLVMLMAGRGRFEQGVLGYLSVSSIALVVAACAINYNYWVNRILLGPLLMLVVCVGMAFTLVEARQMRIASISMLVLLAASVAWAVGAATFNSTNRLVPPGPFLVRMGMHNVGYWNSSFESLRFEQIPSLETPYERLAATVEADHIERLGIDQRVINVPILPLMQLMPNETFGYVGHTVLPKQLSDPQFSPQAVLEIGPAQGYPDWLSTAAQHGKTLLPVQRRLDYVFVLYQPQ